MRIQDIRHRRQELQAQLFKLLEPRSSIGANIVRELSRSPTRKTGYWTTGILLPPQSTNKARNISAALPKERESIWIALQQLRRSILTGS